MPNITRMTSDELSIGKGSDVRHLGRDKFARNTAVGTSLEEIWEIGGDLSYLTSAETMNVASSSVNDDDGGTGANTVHIEGLDNDWNEISETVTMNGTSNVLTTNSYIRVNRMFVKAIGTNGVNVGDITATASTAGTAQARIGAGLGSTLKSQVGIPSGHRAFVQRFFLNTSKGDDIRFIIETREFGESWRVRRDLQDFEAHISVDLRNYIDVGEKGDIRCRAAVSTGSGIVACGYDYFLEKI